MLHNDTAAKLFQIWNIFLSLLHKQQRHWILTFLQLTQSHRHFLQRKKISALLCQQLSSNLVKLHAQRKFIMWQKRNAMNTYSQTLWRLNKTSIWGCNDPGEIKKKNLTPSWRQSCRQTKWISFRVNLSMALDYPRWCCQRREGQLCEGGLPRLACA